jgi:hypothetical protein
MPKKRRNHKRNRSPVGEPFFSHNSISADEAEAHLTVEIMKHLERIGPERFAELVARVGDRAKSLEIADELPHLLSDEVVDEVLSRSLAELRRDWDALSGWARRLVVLSVVKDVVVSPGPGSAADRTRIAWVDGDLARSDDAAGAGPSGSWTGGDVAAILANPFYAIEFAPYLTEPHELVFDEEQWIAVNVALVEQLGAEAYLRNLLSVLRGQ